MRSPGLGKWVGKAALVALLVSLPAAARADFADAVRAYEAGDYATAFAEWLPLAEGGDPAAERNIGHLYRMGWSVPQDFAEAAKWYQRAAEKASPEPRPISPICTCAAKGSRATTSWRSNGSAAPRPRATPWRSTILV